MSIHDQRTGCLTNSAEQMVQFVYRIYLYKCHRICTISYFVYNIVLFKGGLCWIHLNLYPVESSLKNLALKFGNLSLNRENITMFITMLQGLRFTIDNEELVSHPDVYTHKVQPAMYIKFVVYNIFCY